MSADIFYIIMLGVSLLCIIFLVLLFLFYLSAFVSLIYGAPYIPISKKYIKDILQFGGISSEDTFLDMGSGDGRVLFVSKINFGVSKVLGYEVAFWPYIKSRFLIWKNRLSGIKLFRKNFLNADIEEVTFIYLYLFPKLVDKAASKISKGGKVGAKILCVEFLINTDIYKNLHLLKSGKVDNLSVYLYTLSPRDSQLTT